MDNFVKDKQTQNTSYTINNINIGVFSFNLGNLKNQLESQILFDDFKKIFNLNERKIWIITTQEDTSNSFFCNTLKKYFFSSSIKYNRQTITNTITNKYIPSSKIQKKTKKNTTLISNFHNNYSIRQDKDNNAKYYLLSDKKVGLDINLIIKKITFKIHLMIFVPYEMYIQNMFKVLYTNKIKHIKPTKSSILTTFQITLNNESEPIIITAIGSHLPMNTKDSINLGSKERIDSITNVLDLINKKIIIPMNSSLPNATQNILWLGDLNFRLTEQNNIHTDQLINYLKLLSKDPNVLIKLKDFTNIKNIGPTCKLKSIPKIKMQTKCMQQYIGKQKPTDYCYDINKKTEHTFFKKTFIKQRLPSYCDRILGWSKGKYKIVPIDTKVVINTNFDKYSDHNPIMGNFMFVPNKI
jgi:hypothetical protein